MGPKPNESKWYVVYTRPKSEIKVASCISEMGIESYLPLHIVIRQWSDRRKRIKVPLFPNYLFVKLDNTKKRCLFSIREFVRFVSIDKKPVVVREKEIMMIRQILDQQVEVSSEEYFQQGIKVRIRHGQLEGLEGLVIKNYGNTRILVKIDALMRAFSFNVSTKMVLAVLPIDT